MKKALITALLLIAAPLLAQNDLQKNADRVMTRSLEGTSAYTTLETLTDDIGPRLSGSDNANAAVEWAVAKYKSWGIAVHTEPVTVPHWVRGVESATLVSQHNQKLVLTALGGSVATPESGITADVVEVRSFEELKALGREKITGRIVYYDNPMNMDMVRARHSFEAYRDAVEFRTAGASHAAEYGAVATVIRSVASASLRTPHTGSVKYDETQPKIPAAALSVEDAMLLHRLFARGQRVTMHLVLTPQTLPDVQSANVIAEIRGSEHPEEIVLVGAHLDSWDLATGAIDDGSGVAMVMEALHAIGELGLRPKRTIRGVLFMNEENGTRGGKAYFDAHQREKHVAAIETDAGASAPIGFSTTLTGDALAALKSDAKVLARVGAADFENAGETGSDTSSLTKAGIPGFGFRPDPLHYFDYHHSPADTLDKIDPKELQQDTAAVAALTYVLAER